METFTGLDAALRGHFLRWISREIDCHDLRISFEKWVTMRDGLNRKRMIKKRDIDDLEIGCSLKWVINGICDSTSSYESPWTIEWRPSHCRRTFGLETKKIRYLCRKRPSPLENNQPSCNYFFIDNIFKNTNLQATYRFEQHIRWVCSLQQVDAVRSR